MPKYYNWSPFCFTQQPCAVIASGLNYKFPCSIVKQIPTPLGRFPWVAVSHSISCPQSPLPPPSINLLNLSILLWNGAHNHMLIITNTSSHQLLSTLPLPCSTPATPLFFPRTYPAPPRSSLLVIALHSCLLVIALYSSLLFSCSSPRPSVVLLLSRITPAHPTLLLFSPLLSAPPALASPPQSRPPR